MKRLNVKIKRDRNRHRRSRYRIKLTFTEYNPMPVSTFLETWLSYCKKQPTDGNSMTMNLIDVDNPAEVLSTKIQDNEFKIVFPPETFSEKRGGI